MSCDLPAVELFLLLVYLDLWLIGPFLSLWSLTIRNLDVLAEMASNLTAGCIIQSK